MANQHDPILACSGSSRFARHTQQMIGIVCEIVGAGQTGRIRPFQQEYSPARLAPPAYNARPSYQVEDVSALDRCRNEENCRSNGRRVLICEQPHALTCGRGPTWSWLRPIAKGFKPFSLGAANYIKPCKHTCTRQAVNYALSLMYSKSLISFGKFILAENRGGTSSYLGRALSVTHRHANCTQERVHPPAQARKKQKVLPHVLLAVWGQQEPFPIP